MQFVGQVFVFGQNVRVEAEEEGSEEATHFLAKVNDLPAGTARWRKKKDGYKLERFAVLNAYSWQRRRWWCACSGDVSRYPGRIKNVSSCADVRPGFMKKMASHPLAKLLQKKILNT